MEDKKERYKLSSSLKNTARAAAMGGIAGGVGFAANKAVEKATAGAISYAAARAARRMRGRKFQNTKNKRVGINKKPEKKLTGQIFWMVVSVAIIKDALDIFLHVTIVLSALIIMVGIILTFIIVFYLFYSDVKLSSRKLATIIIMGITEILPLFSMLPVATFSLFLVRIFENNELAQKFAKKTMKIGKFT